MRLRRVLRVSSIWFAAVLGFALEPAVAQIDGPPEQLKGARTDRFLAEAATCIAKGEPVRTAQVLALQPGTEQASASILALLRRAALCTPSATMLKAPVTTWRGALAEALYSRTFKTAPVATPLLGADRPEWLSVPSLAAYAITECTAERDPVAADRVVRAARRTPAEAAAVAALLPTLRACGNGRKADFDRVTVHGMIAEGLLRARGGLEVAKGNL